MNITMQRALRKYALPLTVLTLLGSLAAIPAYANDGNDGGGRCEHEHHHDRGAFIEKHYARLHDKLQLTAAQQPAWDSFVAKTKPSDQNARPDWQEIAKLPTPQRLDKVLQIKQEHLQRTEARIQATKEFYATLSAEQKQAFDDATQRGWHHHDHA
jgi:hypothetical protein